MAQKLELTQQNRQTQQLSTMQIAVANLVELPITELVDKVRDEMLDNAALEEADDENAAGHDRQPDSPDDHASKDHADDDSPSDNPDEDYAEAAATDADSYEENTELYSAGGDEMGDYLSPDDVPAYLQERAEQGNARDEGRIAASTSFYDELQQQMGEHNLNAHQRTLMEYLIGSLDHNGFLTKEPATLADEMAIYHGVETTAEELEEVLKVLQRFEPRGIGARNLQECLRLQLTDPDHRTRYTAAALTVVDKYFKDFTSCRWDSLQAKLKLGDDDFAHVRHELTHLNPMPGRALSESNEVEAPTIVPDFFLRVTDTDDIQISLNRGDLPELRISPAFKESVEQYAGKDRRLLSRAQKDAYTYARKKVEAAQTFLTLLARRKHTLSTVMKAIADVQRDFFINDDDEAYLRPLTLREIAERVDMDISTISRVSNSKYVQTVYGTYPLRFFFSSQFTTGEGEELSQRKVMAALGDLLAQEDPTHPLPDEELAAKLKENGFNVARRTVAKYRDLLGYPTARLRKIKGRSIR